MSIFNCLFTSDKLDEHDRYLRLVSRNDFGELFHWMNLGCPLPTDIDIFPILSSLDDKDIKWIQLKVLYIVSFHTERRLNALIIVVP